MSIEQTDKVDIISIDGDTGSVVLTVNDPLDWSDPIVHQVLLQRKLHRYLTFVESGELVEIYPNARGRPIVNRVVFKFAPDEDVRRFLRALKAMLEPMGLTLEWEVFFRER